MLATSFTRLGQYARNMKEHVFIAFVVGRALEVARSTAFDLHATTSLLLNVLHIRPAVADDLRSQVESLNGFQVNGNSFLGPFPLHTC
jgi:hypothetical protein